MIEHNTLWITLLVLFSSLIPHPSSLLYADGGTVRLSEQKGNYLITVFTAPTPVRAGPVDISVLVQAVTTGEPVPEAQVTLKATKRASASVAICSSATSETATNKLFYAATFELPEPGWYALEVSIDGPLGHAEARVELEAAEPLPRWLAMWPWIAWPVLPILLFCIHQFLIRGRSPGKLVPRR